MVGKENKSKEKKKQLFQKIVEYIRNNELATIEDISKNVFGSSSMRVVAGYFLAILCLYDVLTYKKVGRIVTFKIKNLENLSRLLRDWEEKVWF